MIHPAPNIAATSPSVAVRWLRWWAWLSAGLSYLVIAWGGVVRVSGSGLGCGDDWPLCRGGVAPRLDLATALEYGHRLLALLVSAAVLGMAWHAWRNRERQDIRPVVPAATAAVALLGVQIVLGAVTVALTLPAWATVAHLLTSSLLLGSALWVAVRTGDRSGPTFGSTRTTRLLQLTAFFALAVVVVGGVVANLGLAPASPAPSASAASCAGFPLCNGQFIPVLNRFVLVHLLHRSLAFILVALVAALVVVARVDDDRRTLRIAWLAAAFTLAQVFVGVWMVSGQLPAPLRALHMALGVAVWGVLAGGAARVR